MEQFTVYPYCASVNFVIDDPHIMHAAWSHLRMYQGLLGNERNEHIAGTSIFMVYQSR